MLFRTHLLFFLLQFGSLSEGHVTRLEQCQPIKITQCQNMPYNLTEIPSLFPFSTQENASLQFERYIPLLKKECSDKLLFLLCSLYVPICAVSLKHRDRPIKPCRAVCEEARAGCEPIVRQHNYSWPEILDCSNLPTYERGMCVRPDAFVSTSEKTKSDKPTNKNHSTTFKYDKTHKKKTIKKKTNNKVKKYIRKNGIPESNNSKSIFPQKSECKCNRKRPSYHLFKKYKYDFAIRGKMRKRKRANKRDTVYRIKVSQILFHGKVKIPESKEISVYSNSSCLCPKLHRGKDYLILGHEDKTTNTLFITPLAIATKWKPSWTLRIMRWKVKLDTRTEHKRKKMRRQRRKRRRRQREKKTFVKSDVSRLSRRGRFDGRYYSKSFPPFALKGQKQ